ncbi:hypothetical protein F4604DRAFT_1674361 [Suillus subluteus]|nr:hypothetical protein F4604DRAFT_1674361 [Suillus subluteus]
MDPIPSLRSGLTGKIFTEGKPPGEGGTLCNKMLGIICSRYFRGSNKDWNHFIYTHKHVLNALGHFPIKGAKGELLWYGGEAAESVLLVTDYKVDGSVLDLVLGDELNSE